MLIALNVIYEDNREKCTECVLFECMDDLKIQMWEKNEKESG